MAESTWPDEAGEVGRRKGAKSQRCPDEGSGVREEQLVEDERGGGREDEEVIPFDGRADHACDRDLLHAAGRCGSRRHRGGRRVSHGQILALESLGWKRERTSPATRARRSKQGMAAARSSTEAPTDLNPSVAWSWQKAK